MLFDKSLDAKRYKKIVRACALKPDIEVLPAGDLTEIGEKVRFRKLNFFFLIIMKVSLTGGRTF